MVEILQAKEEIIPSNEEQEEPFQEPKLDDLEEGFKVFDKPEVAKSSEANSRCHPIIQVSTTQETLNIPEGMVL